MTNKTIYILLTISLWVFVTLYWILSARKTGKEHRGNEVYSFIKLMGSALIIYLPLITGSFLAVALFTSTFISGLAGFILCITGIAVMVWARVHLGKNWSGNVVIQQGHSLTTDGPYRYLRHPIYAGGLLAMLGTAVVVGDIFGFVWVAFCAFGLIMKLKQEEKLLTEQFADEYSLYKKRVKMLVPFIW